MTILLLSITLIETMTILLITIYDNTITINNINRNYDNTINNNL